MVYSTCALCQPIPDGCNLNVRNKITKSDQVSDEVRIFRIKTDRQQFSPHF